MPAVPRLLRALGRDRPAEGHDTWLTAVHGAQLSALDKACAHGGDERYALFRELDDDLWALLLTQEHAAYPNIKRLLPGVPAADMQTRWCGTSGAPLAALSAAFYRRLRERYAAAGAVPLAEAHVLDFGCGWGRLTRMLARDVAPGNLYACDPSEEILAVCRADRVPATLARSDAVPEHLPFAGLFDLAFAFSVFTHLSEPAHEACLRALHASLAPGGILVVTVRPPAYLALMAPGRDDDLRGAAYVFEPHPGDLHYGEAIVTLDYVRERWSRCFELLQADLLIGDLHQVVLTLRRS
jgi:SAM-dependent methyltransferase